MAQAAQEGGKSGDPSSPTVGSKKSSVAQAAGAEIVAPPARIKLKPKDQLQKTVFREQVNNFAQNAFITGVNNLQMNLDVSLNFLFKFLIYHFDCYRMTQIAMEPVPQSLQEDFHRDLRNKRKLGKNTKRLTEGARIKAPGNAQTQRKLTISMWKTRTSWTWSRG